MASRINTKSTDNIENLGTKVVFGGKMCGKSFFYAKNNFGITHFSLFVIDAWKYIYL